jgi:hypothetical protein
MLHFGLFDSKGRILTAIDGQSLSLTREVELQFDPTKFGEFNLKSQKGCQMTSILLKI